MIMSILLFAESFELRINIHFSYIASINEFLEAIQLEMLKFDMDSDPKPTCEDFEEKSSQKLYDLN